VNYSQSFTAVRISIAQPFFYERKHFKILLPLPVAFFSFTIYIISVSQKAYKPFTQELTYA